MIRTTGGGWIELPVYDLVEIKRLVINGAEVEAGDLAIMLASIKSEQLVQARRPNDTWWPGQVSGPYTVFYVYPVSTVKEI